VDTEIGSETPVHYSIWFTHFLVFFPDEAAASSALRFA